MAYAQVHSCRSLTLLEAVFKSDLLYVGRNVYKVCMFARLDVIVVNCLKNTLGVSTLIYWL